MSSSQNSATIFSLQTYITQLTCYINENNAKYTKNLETLKSFYETQVQDLQAKLSSSQQEKLQMRNDLLATRDLLNNRQRELGQTKMRLGQTIQQNEDVRERLSNERKKMDQLYEEIQLTKKQFRRDLDQQERIAKEVQNQKNDLILKLKERQQQISRLNKDIERLQDQVSQRYSLPQKLKDIEIESAKNKTLVQTLTQSKRQLETKLDFQSNELERLRKQNKRLEVNYETRDANAKKQVNQSLMKQRQIGQQKQKRLQSTNEKQLFEITELQNSLKLLKKQNSELQKRLHEQIEECKLLNERISNHDTQKDQYIGEFQKLKHEYEEVIKNLEDAIPKYQKKNWDLEQQNRDLNVQLDGLRDLLNEVKTMNSLQPLKQEYRQIAELELLAQKDYKAYKAEENNYQVQLKKVKGQTIDNSFKILSPVKDQQNDDDFKWDKLLAEIDNIQVS